MHSSDFRAKAREILNGKWGKAALITLLCDILKGIVSILIALIIGRIVKDIDRAFLVQIAGLLVVVRTYISYLF